MIEETEYDDVVQCDHSYDKRCHTTYVTNYESQQASTKTFISKAKYKVSQKYTEDYMIKSQICHIL